MAQVVMLCVWLHGPAPQLPLFYGLSSRPSLYTSSTFPPQLQLWQEGLGGFGFWN